MAPDDRRPAHEGRPHASGRPTAPGIHGHALSHRRSKARQTPPAPLVCPRCGERQPAEERFCPACRVPLTYAGAEGREDDVTARQRWARKIKPQLTEGPLVKVAGARNQAEAEFVQGLLIEEGVPSVTRRARGFDVPDFLAAGPRDVLVPASGETVAREVLLQSDLGAALAGGSTFAERPARLLAGMLATLVLVAVIAWVGTALLG